MEEELKADLGLVHVITGDGRGKTTSAMGLALRAIGRGLKVCLIQFMKGFEYGEIIAAEGIGNLETKQFGRAEFVNKDSPEKVDIEQAAHALDHAKGVVNRGECDLAILDEVNVAIDFKLIRLEDVVKLVKEKPKNVELVLTGRNAPQELIELADYVSEIRDIKHPYKKGLEARKGIEY